MKIKTKLPLSIFMLSLVVSAIPFTNKVQAATPTNIDYSKLQVVGVPNNAAAIIMPIIEKSEKSVGSLAASEIKSSFSTSFASYIRNVQSNFSFGVNSVAQNIFNPLTHENETNQNAATINYSIDPVYFKSAFGKDQTFNQGSITFQTKYFKTKAGSDIYFNITSMPGGLYALISKMTDQSNRLLLNTWYKYSLNTTNLLGKKTTVSPMAPAQSTDRQYLLYTSKLLFSNLTLVQDFGVEKMQMGSARHLKLGLTSQGVINFVKATQTLGASTQNDSAVAEIQSQLVKTLATPEAKNLVSGTTIDLWIGENDSRIYKVLISGKGIQIPLNSYQYTPLNSNQNTNTIQATNDKVIADLNISSEAQTVNTVPRITPPLVFTDLNKVYEKSMATTKQRGKSAGIGSMISNTRAQAELYYSTTGNNTYTGVCTSSKQGLKTLISDIKKNFPGTVVNCKSKTSAYIINAKVAAGQYVCADSTGNYMSTNKIDKVLGKTYSCK